MSDAAGSSPSTRNLAALPGVETVRRRLQQWAALAAALAPDDEGPPFEFHPRWDASEQMGAFKNGVGDELFAHFTPAGCCLIGFAHESAMSPYRVDPPALWPGLVEDVPAAFRPSLDEPAFDLPATTFVVWRAAGDDAWRTGPVAFPADELDPDGSADLLRCLGTDADGVAAWLAEYYEVDMDAAVVAEVLDHRPLTADRLRRLNPDAPLPALRAAVAETGYPTV